MLSRNFNSMVNALGKSHSALERKNDELALKNSYIDAVFQSLKINIIVLDTSLKIKVVNRNAESRFELSDDCLNRYFFDVEPFSSAADSFREPLEEVFETGCFKRLSTVVLGSSAFEADFYPALGSGGGSPAVVVILNNITERMNMERALVHSDRLASLGTLAAGLAHEINNPLGIILNHVQLLGSGALTDEQEERFLGRIESEIKRMSRLINNLLRFSREETSAAERTSPHDVLVEVMGLIDPAASAESVESFYSGGKTVERPADSYTLKFKDRRVRIFLTAGLSSDYIYCSRDSLKQIFFNILKNAIESCSPSGGIICCASESSGGDTLISISDNGCGIADKQKVFELFHSETASGSGIGLPLCRTLMENIGGSISLDDSECGGAAVILRFPAVGERYEQETI